MDERKQLNEHVKINIVKTVSEKKGKTYYCLEYKEGEKRFLLQPGNFYSRSQKWLFSMILKELFEGK